MADLSRDTANAHNALENNFDKQAIKDKLEIQQQATSLGTQAMTAYMDSKLDAAKKKVRDEMAARGELKGLSDEEINDKVTASAEFKEVDKEYGIGSPFWTASSAMTGLLAGVLGGNAQSGMAAGAAPVLAKLVKEATHESEAARIALHTVISAALAKAQGGNATAGAIGGFIASAGAEQFAQALYGKKADQLNPDEKMVILNLVSAVGAVGGGVATGNTNGMVSAGNAARVEVENNFLGVKDITTFTEKYANAKTDEEREQLLSDLKKLDVEQQAKALATGIPVNEQKAELEKLKALAASPDCNTQCQGLVAYSISELEPVANNTDLHKNNLNKAILAGVIFGLTVEKPAANNPISRLTREQQQLIKNAEYITTAKGIQNPFPRDLNEKIVWNQVRTNPASAGEPLKGMNKDLRFPTSAGFQKMEAKQKLSDGSTITVHYQYNSFTDKAYDMKITTPQRNVSDPAKVIESIKDAVK
ncbi:VENN motif pre-toxin domain-containing protein [Kosakonia sp. ML.JS2a]|uniref:VENN motif pre-toxin domain-containing protein n=1 Tax=Kosakonia sp. ML.JS2a TaxID=2980557 RepID=UPI0021DA035B|nr:VENN motif pre-toxin domain-containing protein [Kosakonia sp. ML.JS2a]UXY10997.1 VENN motif pre-toxin domain-containing protein [Kosakonia sp. ML.JS2a]